METQEHEQGCQTLRILGVHFWLLISKMEIVLGELNMALYLRVF